MLNRTQVQQALMLILKHFGPGNPDAKGLLTKKK